MCCYLTIILVLLCYQGHFVVFSNNICNEKGCSKCVYVSTKFTEKTCTPTGENWNCSDLSTAFDKILSLDNFCFLLNDSQSLKTQITRTKVKNLTVIGFSHDIDCSGQNSGFLFYNSDMITFRNLNLKNCGGEVNSTAYDTRDHTIIPAKISSALYFDNTKNIQFDNVMVSSSKGYGIFMLDCIGDIHFSKLRVTFNTPVTLSSGNYNFTSGGGIVFQHLSVGTELSSNNIKVDGQGTQISYITSHTQYDWIRPFGHGGGISLLFLGNTTGNIVTIKGASINQNKAVSGGGVYIEHGLHSANNDIVISYSPINSNVAKSSGGGISYYTERYPALQNNTLTLLNLQIIGNSAGNGDSTGLGGGFSQRKKRDNEYLPDVNTSYTKITGGFTQIRLNEAGLGTGLYVDTANVAFIQPTRSILISNNGNKGGYGTIYCYKSKLSIIGEVDILNSLNTGVVLDNSLLSLTSNGSVFLWGNHGIDGGAIALYEQSEIHVGRNAFLNFERNTANRGGAIFLDVPDLPYRISNINNRLLSYTCFFKFEEGAGVTNFTENRAADNRGNSIFATTLQHCSDDFRTSKKLNFTKNEINPVKTNPFKMNATTTGSTIVYPGEVISINVSLMDEFDSPIHSTVHLEITPPSITADHDYKQISSDFMNVTISGPRQTAPLPFQLKLTPLQGIAPPKVLNFTLINCIFGYSYNTTTKQCSCSLKDDNIIGCNNSQIYLKKNIWVFANQIHQCPTDYCSCTYDARWGGCEYTPGGNQCAGNRDNNSTLCSRCLRGESVPFGGEICNQCGSSYNIIWIIPLIFTGILVLEFVFLKCDIDVYKYYLNSFFYIYQIAALVEYDNVYPGIKTLIGIVNLSGLHLGNKGGLCVLGNFSDLDKNMFNYLFPVLALLGLWILVKLDRFTQEKCYHAMVFIIFWSYADVVRITFAILIPTKIAGKSHLRVYCDGESEYFIAVKHIVYGIIALTAMALVILFPLGLLCSSFLVRFRCFARLLPIFNCFKFCFKDDFWSQTFASNYFIFRFLFNVIQAVQPVYSLLKLQTIFTCLSVLILLVFVVSKPYKAGEIDAPDNYNYLNYYDTIMLGILTAVAVLYNGRQKFPSKDATGKRIDIIVNILLSLPFVWVLGNILMKVFYKLKDLYEIFVAENDLQEGFCANMRLYFGRRKCCTRDDNDDDEDLIGQDEGEGHL